MFGAPPIKAGRHTFFARDGKYLVVRHGDVEVGKDTIPPAAKSLLRELANDHLPTGLLLGKPARGLCNFEWTRTMVAGRREGDDLHLIWRDERSAVIAEDVMDGAERSALIAWLEALLVSGSTDAG